MADTDNLAATLTDSPSTGGGLDSALASRPMSDPANVATLNTAATNSEGPNPAPDLGGTAPLPIAAGPSAQPAAPPPDLPRFQRTFSSTLKSMLIGFGMGGVPGAVAGAVDPQAIQQARANKQAIGQAKITFANAQAAHEVAMAHQADVEYQAMPEKLQQDAERRGVDNLEAAKKAGYLPVASIPLDQGKDQNSQNAMTALNSVKTQFGAVPSGLLYIHTGSGVTVMKLQDPNAALPAINQARRAQGMPQLTQDQFSVLQPADRDSMARNAMNFTNPRDTTGMVSQQSLNEAQMRLETVKSQPDFTGKDDLVTQLTQTVAHQKDVLDSGAAQEAARKGAAAGTEATAAQPGTTAAKVAEAAAMAKTPQEKSKLALEGAQTTEALAQAKKAEADTGLAAQKPIFAFNTQTKQIEQTTRSDMQANPKLYTNPVDIKEGDLEKNRELSRQLGDAQLNISRYKAASDAAGNLATDDHSIMADLMSDKQLKVGFFGTELPTDFIGKLYSSSEWGHLTPEAQRQMIAYIGSRGAIVAYQKAVSGSGRANKEQLDLELQNLPSPIDPPAVRDAKFERFQQNIDQAGAGMPKLIGIDRPQEIRSRIEADEAKKQGATHVYDPTTQTAKPTSFWDALKAKGPGYQ